MIKGTTRSLLSRRFWTCFAFASPFSSPTFSSTTSSSHTDRRWIWCCCCWCCWCCWCCCWPSSLPPVQIIAYRQKVIFFQDIQIILCWWDSSALLISKLCFMFNAFQRCIISRWWCTSILEPTKSPRWKHFQKPVAIFRNFVTLLFLILKELHKKTLVHRTTNISPTTPCVSCSPQRYGCYFHNRE